jgi:hypothetical protein
VGVRSGHSRESSADLQPVVLDHIDRVATTEPRPNVTEGLQIHTEGMHDLMRIFDDFG